MTDRMTDARLIEIERTIHLYNPKIIDELIAEIARLRVEVREFRAGVDSLTERAPTTRTDALTLADGIRALSLTITADRSGVRDGEGLMRFVGVDPNELDLLIQHGKLTIEFSVIPTETQRGLCRHGTGRTCGTMKFILTGAVAME